MTWDLEVGDWIRRVELHDRYGGGRQGGIAGSRTTPNVLIFSDPETGETHGYYDHWDGAEYQYAGEGQTGDQKLDRGNRAILDHKSEDRALRLFWGSTGTVQYAGEFELADPPYHWEQTHESGGATLRRVVMFHLRPLGTPTTPNPAAPARKFVTRLPLSTAYRNVDPDSGAPPRDPFAMDPAQIERGLQGHMRTQQSLSDAIRDAGHEPLSPSTANGDPNFDLAWREGDHAWVVEVKSLTSANEAGQIRLGLGQVLDYQNDLETTGATVTPVLALEVRPADTRWADLCSRHGVRLVWPATFTSLFD